MKLKDIIKLIMVYVLLFIAGSGMYVLGIRSGIFDGITIFFYRGIFAIIVAGLVIAGIMIVLKATKMRKIITIRDILLLFCVFCCIQVVIFTHLPVTADRSVSVFMLGYMNQKNGECTKQELEDVFIEKYVYEYKAFDKRLFEQIYTGTIEEKGDGEYILTDSGKRIINLYEVAADWFKIDKKLISP
jgi:hypothetical protein